MMPYKLRPESKRKKTVRFEGTCDSEGEGTSDQHSDPSLQTAGSQPGLLAVTREALRLSVPGSQGAVPAFYNTVTAAPLYDPAIERDSASSHTMVNFKNVRKRSRAYEESEADGPPTGRPKSHQTNRQPSQSPPPHMSALSKTTAAFLSLDSHTAASKPTVAHDDWHGLRDLVRARASSDQKATQRNMTKVVYMYENRQFPKEMSEKERSWYIELKKRWPPHDDYNSVSSAPNV